MRACLNALAVLAALAAAEPLLDVLRQNGFNEYAALIERNPVPLNGPGAIVYAATDAALSYNKEDGLTARQEKGFAGDSSRIRYSYADSKQKVNWRLHGHAEVNTSLDAFVPLGGSVISTYLNDTRYVSLGPGRSQVVVERSLIPGSLPRVFCGLAQSVQVVASDISFDQGVIRPVNGLFTLPADVSQTLKAVHADFFEAFIRKFGLLDDLESRTGIAILAPVGLGLNLSFLLNPNPIDLIKRHIVVDVPSYTPMLKDGDVLPTLAGTSVRVSVRNGVITIGGAEILFGDAIMNNGVIHVINRVIGS